MKQCLECGTFSSDDTIFCCVCGKRFSDATDLPAVESNQSENEQMHNYDEKITSTTHPEIVPLLQRVGLFLEDNEFDRADEYCERTQFIRLISEISAFNHFRRETGMRILFGTWMPILVFP